MNKENREQLELALTSYIEKVLRGERSGEDLYIFPAAMSALVRLIEVFN